MRTTQRPWIPPGGLLIGFFAHALSWIVLLALALRHAPGTGLEALAWVHVVALGWLTMTALSVLLHVIPTFTDVAWKGKAIARSSLIAYATGIAVLTGAFWWRAVAVLPIATTLVVIGLCGYLAPAALTLASAYRGPRTEAAIARALSLTLAALLLTAALGSLLGWTLAGRLPTAFLVHVPAIHAALGTFAWLTALVMGVSTRTVRPISGARSRVPWVHPAAGVGQFSGVLAFAAGLATRLPALAWGGAAIIATGALLYAVDLADVLRRATNPHRPPQAFIWAALCWLALGLGLALATLAGNPWGAATVYVQLVGWIGQMVNGHLHHIGIRLIATMSRGDDDETEPRELLTAPLTWLTFVFFQAAVALGAGGLLASDAHVVEAAAACGLIGCLTMAANVRSAWLRAARARTAHAVPPVSLLRGRVAQP